MPSALDKIALEFRSAVLAGDHVRAERLVSEYRDAVTRIWRALPEESRGTSVLPKQANELLTWARGMTIVQRAILGEQLSVLEKSKHYAADQDPQQRFSIQLSL